MNLMRRERLASTDGVETPPTPQASRRYGMTGSLSCRRRARARDKVAEAAYDSRVDTERGARVLPSARN